MEKLKKDLIKLLGENAKYSYKQMASMLGVLEVDVEKAVKEMEKDGVILKYAAIFDTESIEDSVEALIEVKVAPQKLNGFDSYAETIYQFPEVKSLYLMSGGFDLAIFVEGKNLTDLSKFVAEKLSVIDGITAVQTHFVLKKYKVEGQITGKPQERKRQIIGA